jgi:hypothetical protein
MAEAAAKSDSVQFNKPRAPRDCRDEIDILRLPKNKELRPEGNHSRGGAESVSSGGHARSKRVVLRDIIN